MSGHNAPDDAGRLESALDRISRAASRRPPPGLRATAALATSSAEAGPASEVATRLDALIADLRAALGTQG